MYKVCPLRARPRTKIRYDSPLTKFHRFPGDDPNKHLKEFHIVYSSMKSQGISEDGVKFRAFPFSLADSAKEWLCYLLSGTIDN